MASAGAIRAGEAFVELSARDTSLSKSLDVAARKIQMTAATLNRVGASAVGLGAKVAASLAAVVPVANALLDREKIANAGKAFGMTAEQASRLFGIMGAAGSDVRDATEGLVTLNQRVQDALAGAGKEAAELFAGLGVSAKEFESLDTAERFYKLVAALKAVPDPARRVQLLLKAVGEDTGKNLIPLLSMSDNELRKLGDRFEMTTAEMEESTRAAVAYKAAVLDIREAWGRFVTAIAPVIADNAKLALGIAAVAAGLIALGVVAKAAGVALAAFTAIASPFGIVVVALAGLTAAFVSCTDDIRGLFTDLWRDIQIGFLRTVVGIIDGINKAADFLAAFPGGNAPPTPEMLEKFKRLNAPIQQRAEEEAAFRKRQQDKLAALGPGKFVGPGLPLDFGINQVAADALIESLKRSNDRMEALSQESRRIWQEIKLGEKFIDPRPFENAIERLKEGAKDAGDNFGKAAGRGIGFAMHASLVSLFAALPFAMGADDRVAPMPRLRPDLANRFGTAARGLVDSGDFRGALSIGPSARDVQGQQLDAMKNVGAVLETKVLPELQRIKIEAQRFT